MNKPKIAVQTIVFSSVIHQEGYDRVMRFIRQQGVKEVELSKVPVNQETMPQIENLCRELGLHICVMNVGLEPAPKAETPNLQENLDTMAEYAKRLDCRYLRIGSLPYWCYGKREGHLRYAELLNQYGERLSRYGIKLYHHHHELEFQKYDGVYGMDLLIENTSPEYVGFELDTHWLQFGGQNPSVWIEKLKGRADLVHLKDYRIVMPEEGVLGEERSPKELRKKVVQFAEIGTGNLDIKGIIDTCISTGVVYMPIEQDTSYKLSPFDSISISVENLKKAGFSDCF